MSRNTERWLIVLLCAVAAARVFVFAAAFPSFNNVDERAHVDLVFKYSHGYLPHGLDNFSAEAAYYFALYSSPEYFTKPEDYGEKYPPPNWTITGKERDRLLSDATALWQARQNHESGEPPLYYATIALWLDLGKAFGISGGWLLYWMRFLNVFIVAALVWLGFIVAKAVFPDRELLGVGVALLLAVWPQSALYSVQPDALSPLCFGIAFVGLLKLLQADSPSIRLGAGLGLALAATLLTKTSSMPLLMVAGATLVFKGWRLARNGMLRQVWLTLAALVACAGVPIGAWFAWNYQIFGDLTGTTSKIQLLDWPHKPIADWWSHPIFTPHGLKEFWSELVASFWRGEFIWHGQRLASSVVDLFYWISSTVIIVLALIGLFPRFARTSTFQRQALWLATASFAALVGFIALLSIAFDFGKCVYPSHAHPFFTSGRLLDAAAIPFFLLYVYALDLATGRAKQRLPGSIALGAIVLLVLISQFAVNWPAFGSHYNFFHMWQ